MDRFFATWITNFFTFMSRVADLIILNLLLHCLLHSGGDHWTFHCRHVLRHFENGS